MKNEERQGLLTGRADVGGDEETGVEGRQR